MTNTKRLPADYAVIAHNIKSKILPSIHDAQEDLVDLLDYELSAQLVRNLIGVQKELDRAEKSAAAALAVANLETE